MRHTAPTEAGETAGPTGTSGLLGGPELAATAGLSEVSAGAAPTDPPAAATSAPAQDACLPEVVGLLDGMPRQRGVRAEDGVGAAGGCGSVGAVGALSALRAAGAASAASAVRVSGAVVPASDVGAEVTRSARRSPVRIRGRIRVRGLRPWRLLPTPTGTPFTFAYGVVLAVLAFVAAQVDPSLVHDLHQGSSTDVAHLVRTPGLVLVGSALWIAGGILSPYALALLFVLTALERRIGGPRTAGVFLLGHIGATLATEVPIGVAVLVGHLPASSLHRLDYGVSFGVAASIGALAGLLGPWLRWPLLALFGWMLLTNLLAYTDPMTDWGHLIALAIGVATWPLVRRRRRARVPNLTGQYT